MCCKSKVIKLIEKYNTYFYLSKSTCSEKVNTYEISFWHRVTLSYQKKNVWNFVRKLHLITYNLTEHHIH